MIDPVYDDEPTPSKPKTRISAQTVIAAGLTGLIIVTLGVLTASAGAGSLIRIAMLLLLVIGPALLGAWLGQTRPIGPRAGFFIGLLLNMLGVLIVFAIPARAVTKECPFCAERIRLNARVCRYCDRNLPK